MSEIKAIETVYNGYRFRSRLEARWAVFFDAAGIDYQYEPEGFKIDGIGGETIYYLPDFYLPEIGCYVEVKGTDAALAADGYKIACAVDFENTPCSQGLLILGNIPNPEEITWGNVPIFSYLYNNHSVCHSYAAFISEHWKIVLKKGDDIISSLYTLATPGSIRSTWSDCYADRNVPEATSVKYKMLESSMATWTQGRLKEAYTKARQARFEHGETPAPYHDEEIPF